MFAVGRTRRFVVFKEEAFVENACEAIDA